jgi:hypothetical protein
MKVDQQIIDYDVVMKYALLIRSHSQAHNDGL